jgi:hypothetical protein
MKRISWVSHLALVGLAATAAAAPTAARAQESAAIPVSVVRAADGSWQLLRGGRPYVIRGAGGDGTGSRLELLKRCGGNSVRTWGADAADKTLDAAAKAGTTATVGIWLRHPGDGGFRYDDPKMVADQQADCERVVRQYRDAPALLIWGLGNEMEGDGADAHVWAAIENIARAVKRIDPNHPTMTVIAEIGGDGFKARQVAALCPDIDILGVNSYAGLDSLPQRLRAAGWTKPYIVTEFGPSGQWEVGKTSWGAPIEATSTEKAQQYSRRYQESIAAQKGWCLGSYAFLWGTKVEATPTWFGMFLPDSGERLAAVDAMQAAWSGTSPAHPVPAIVQIGCTAGQKEVSAGTTQTVTLAATGDGPLNATYVIAPELGTDSHEPGQPAAPALAAGTLPAGAPGLAGSQSFSVPDVPGAYRIYVTVRDTHGGAAVANIPFYVQASQQASALTAPPH